MSDRCWWFTVVSLSHPTLGFRLGSVVPQWCAGPQTKDAEVTCGC
jgi:hypothetical protein